MNSPPRLVNLRAVAGVVAVTALAVGGLVLVRGSGNDRTPPTPSSTTPPTTARAVASSTTTSRPAPVHTVSVPNVIGLTRAAALGALTDAGFEVHITSIALSSVPDGFVVSQSPLPATQIRKGSNVALVVSAAG
jgi:PASTA domain